MTYRPAEAVFGPPWTVRFPSVLHLIVAALAVAIVVIGESSPSDSWLFVLVVEDSADRVIGARTVAVALVISSVASLIRTNMRGVRVRADGLEYRDLISLSIPRVRRYKWAQIDRVILDQRAVALDLWDGSRAHLPPVGDRDGLAATLEKVAVARAIPVRGGGRLDELPDSGEYQDD